MTHNASDMRRLLDSMMVSETEELNELLGTQTARNLASKVSSVKHTDVKKKEGELYSQLLNTFKRFVAGKTRHPDYAGVKMDPKDPGTLRAFLDVVGFEPHDITALAGPAMESETNGEIENQLLREFLGTPGDVKSVLKKAAEYAVDNKMQLGSGKAGSSGGKGKDTPSATAAGGKEVSPQAAQAATAEADPGLDQLGPQIAKMVKRISPQAAEILDLQLFDGFDMKAANLKAAVEKNPNNPLALLALVGFAYMSGKVKPGGAARREEPEATDSEQEQPAEEPKRGVDIQ